MKVSDNHYTRFTEMPLQYISFDVLLLLLLFLLQNKKVYHNKQRTGKHTVSNEACCVRLFVMICCGKLGYGATRWRTESALNLLRIGPTQSSAALRVHADKLLLSSAFATVMADRHSRACTEQENAKQN